MGGAWAPKPSGPAVAEDPGAAAAAAAAAPSSEKTAEDALGEADVEHIAEIEALEDVFLAEFLPEDLGAELVVLLLLFGIAQDRVGFADLLEFLLRLLLVTLGFVRMVLQGQLAVGLLDFFGRGLAAHSQYLIVIHLRHGAVLTILRG